VNHVTQAGAPARDVASVLATLPVTRLVHFTPAMNLFSILRDGEIRPSDDLEGDEQPHFTATDRQRIDGHPEHVCCSFEYPNAYYQAQARTKNDFVNYPQWVCLILDVNLVLRDGVLFYPCNAAKGWGQHGGTGPQHLLNMWANPSKVGGYRRKPRHHPAVPTDVQSEVQIPGAIPLSAVKAIVAESAEHCQDLYGTLDAHQLVPGRFDWRFAPLFYDRQGLAAAIHSGAIPPEYLWPPIFKAQP
jgi:hypothetical protein